MLGLYVHVPFCVKKCNYCDFVSKPSGCDLKEKYVDAVVSEIRRRGNGSMRCDTVFIGGGTPSVLTERQLDQLINALRGSFNIDENAEFTVEANPESLTYEKALMIKHAGVNRLSIGFQSLAPRALKLLGRAHDADKALEAFDNARRAGFDNVNVDLIFGLPGEPAGEFEDTLRRVVDLSPEHISAYSLIVEEGTPLERDIASGVTPEPDDLTDRNDCRFAIDYLKDAGYSHYEISNFAKPGRESKHNTRYWLQDEYLGFGPAASSFEGGRRYTNTRDIDLYIEKNGLAELDEDCTLTREELMNEYMMLGFRLIAGPNVDQFERKFGVPAAQVFGKKLEALAKKGLITIDQCDRSPYRLTAAGLDFANEVFREFV